MTLQAGNVSNAGYVAGEDVAAYRGLHRVRVHRGRNALSMIIVPASPGRSTLSAGEIASGFAVMSRVIKCSAAYHHADNCAKVMT